MKKLILTLALFVGVAVISNAQTSTTGATSTAGTKQETPNGLQPSTLPQVVPTTTTTEPAPAATPAPAPAKKSNKKACCQKKASSCCKKKSEAIKED
jgi:hypothetical protein